MNRINKLIENKHTSIKIPFVGILAQCISWVVLFPIGVAVHKNKIGTACFSALSAVWFFVPLISIFGVYSGVKFIHKNGFSASPAVGIGLNVIWFLLFLGVCYVVFYVGISV